LQAARQHHRAAIMRQLLIGAQVAASCVLLIVAGLLVRALNHAIYTHPGFAYQRAITIDPALRGYTPAKAQTYFEELEPRLHALPGVEAVALVSNPPLGNRWTVLKTQIAGQAVDIHINHIDPDFFQTMEIPILRGRNLVRGESRAIVVSESLARRRWPSEDPVGKPFEMGADRYNVVGVCGSARLVSPEDSDAVEIYQLAGTDLMPSMVVLVRTSGSPERVARLAEAAAKAIDPRLFPEVLLMKDAFRGKLEVSEYVALAAGLPGLIALLLACFGILGLVSYAVSQRTREIGIRMALGAQPAQVLSAVMRQFWWPAGLGLIAGIGGAAALSQVLRQVLYGISNLDPISYLAAIGIFSVMAAVAVALPAKRALRIDPMRALHYE
jgi:predicted permease